MSKVGRGRAGPAESAVAAVSLSGVPASALFTSRAIWAWRWSQRPGPSLGASVSSKPGTFQGLLEPQPQTVRRPVLTPTEGSAAWGCVGMGCRQAVIPDKLGPPAAQGAKPGVRRPPDRKQSLWIQRKLVELRRNESVHLPPGREKAERPRKTQPGTLGFMGNGPQRLTIMCPRSPRRPSPWALGGLQTQPSSGSRGKPFSVSSSCFWPIHFFLKVHAVFVLAFWLRALSST